MDKFSIYKITNIINNKVYIGKTTRPSFLERIHQHIIGAKAIMCGKNDNPTHLQKAINKYGVNNFKFEKLCSCKTEETLNILETAFIKKYKSYISNFGYNKTMGGDGNKHTVETIEKVTGENNPFYGKHHTEETKQLMSQIWEERLADSNYIHPAKGRKFKEESKEKFKQTELERYGGYHWKGRKHKEETKQAISESSKNRILINNGIIEKYIKNYQPIPEGFVKGILHKITNGKIAINNGEIFKYIMPNEIVPFGWQIGIIRDNSYLTGENSNSFKNKGRIILINNGTISKNHFINKPIPDGWMKGNCNIQNKGDKNPMFGKIGELAPGFGKRWITNGNMNMRINKDAVLPEGFDYGKSHKTNQQINSTVLAGDIKENNTIKKQINLK